MRVAVLWRRCSSRDSALRVRNRQDGSPTSPSPGGGQPKASLDNQRAHAIDAQGCKVTHGTSAASRAWPCARGARGHRGRAGGPCDRGRRTAARYRQACRPGAHPQQAEQAHACRVRTHEVKHARVGGEILSEADFLYPVVPIVRHHHENWDGTGGPDGLKGDIPIGARILSVVDRFDALTSDRPYRRALSAREAFAIIEARSATITIRQSSRPFGRCTSTQVAGADGRERGRGGRRDVECSPYRERSFNAGRHRRIATRTRPRSCAFPESPSRSIRGANSPTLCNGFRQSTLSRFSSLTNHSTDLSWPARQYSCSTARGAVDGDGRPISGWVAATGQPMVNAEAGLFDLFDVFAPALRAAIAVPCSTPAGAKGMLTLYSAKPDAFSSLHHRLLVRLHRLCNRSGASTPGSRASIPPIRLECGGAGEGDVQAYSAVSSELRNPSLTQPVRRRGGDSQARADPRDDRRRLRCARARHRLD